MKTLLLVILFPLIVASALAQDKQERDLTFADFIGIWDNSDLPGFCYDIRVNQGKLEFWPAVSPARAKQEAQQAFDSDLTKRAEREKELLGPPTAPVWILDGEEQNSHPVAGGEDRWHTKISSVLRANEIFMIELTRRNGPATRLKVTENGKEVRSARNDRPPYDYVWAKYFRITLHDNRQLLTIRDFRLDLVDERFPADGDAGLEYGPHSYVKVDRCE